MKLPRSRIFTFIVYRPSQVRTSLGCLNSYSESDIEVQDFLEHDRETMIGWLQGKYCADLRLRAAQDWHSELHTMALVNGVISTRVDSNDRADVESIVRLAVVQAAAIIEKEAETAKQEAQTRAAAAESRQFALDMQKIRVLAAKYDPSLLDASGIRVL